MWLTCLISLSLMCVSPLVWVASSVHLASTRRVKASLASISGWNMNESVLRIRIRNRIRMFLGLPDPLARVTDPGIWLRFSHKCVERTWAMPLQNKILRQGVIVRTYIICELTINVSLIFVFLRANYFMGHLRNILRGQKAEAPSKYLEYPMK